MSQILSNETAVLNNSFHRQTNNILKRKAPIIIEPQMDNINSTNNNTKIEMKKMKIENKDIDDNNDIDENENIPCKYLMPIHIVTCGLQGDDLGRDETAILEISFQIIDVNTKKIVVGDRCLLTPSSLLDYNADPSKIHISVPAREMTGLLHHHTYQITANPSIYLTQALQQIHMNIQYLTSDNPQQIVPVTCGDLPIRAVLQREARFRQIPLPEYWFSYYNLFEQTQSNSINSLMTLCKELQIAVPHSLKTSCEILNSMSQCIVQILMTKDHFSHINTIQTTYLPAVFHIDDEIDDDVVVMIKPIDYKTPVSQILPFFRGVNIAPGGLAILMADGRRSNKILVRFMNKKQRDIALMRDKHHFEMANSRFITMATHDSKEFMKIAGYRHENVQQYLNQISTSDQVLVRMKGLPFTVSKSDILTFFDSHSVSVQNREKGIFLVEKAWNSGELNGDAFVLFETESVAQQGIRLKGGTIGNRYVEIFQSTPAEMNQVMATIPENGNSASPNNQKGNLLGTNKSKTNLGLMGPGIITSMVPGEATDSDYLKFLGDVYNKCNRLTRLVYQNPLGHVAYLAELKDINADAPSILRLLSNRLFTVEKTRSHHVVTTTLFNPQPTVPSTLLKSPPLPQPTSIFSSLLPPPSTPTITTPISTASFLPQLSSPFLYPSTTSNPLLTLTQPQLLTTNSPNSILLPSPPAVQTQTQISPAAAQLLNQTYPQLFNYTNGIKNNIDFTKNILVPSNNISTNSSTSNLVYLYGAHRASFSQLDLDVIFNSIKIYISELPKLFQNDHYLYACFSTKQDAITAMQKCPIICHKNQIVRLMPINT